LPCFGIDIPQWESENKAFSTASGKNLDKVQLSPGFNTQNLGK
jgi:hypothetical protein